MAAVSSVWQCDVCQFRVEIAGSIRPTGWDDKAKVVYKRHTGQGYSIDVEKIFTVCERCNNPHQDLKDEEDLPAWLNIVRQAWYNLIEKR